MTNKYKHRKMRGGFFNTLSSIGTSLSQGASDLWNRTKRAIPSTSTSYTSYPPPPQPSTTATYGGKTRRNRRKIGGSIIQANSPTIGIASTAASFSGKTAQPHNIVGGKTKRKKQRRTRKR